MAESDLRIEAVRKAYGGRCVLDGVSFQFASGRANVIMGPSGCGKTTLLRIIAGLETADSGRILGIQGKKISAVFQEDRLFSNLSAEKNVRITARGGFSRADVRQLLADLGLERDAARPVREFSGGMARRVAIARALAAQYDLLLLDEPLQGLDAETRQRARECILRHAAGRTLLWVTHDAADAALLNAQVLHLQAAPCTRNMPGPQAATPVSSGAD